MYTLKNPKNNIWEVIDMSTGKIVDYYNELTKMCNSGVHISYYGNVSVEESYL